MAAHNYTSICEDEFNVRFDIEPYSSTSDSLQATYRSWEAMLSFTRKLAISYGLTEADWYRFLWTSFEGDDGIIYLTNGTRFVNRLDFWFSKKPWGIGDKKIDDKIHIEVTWN